MTHGSCQQFIRSSDVKSVIKDARIACIDNPKNESLKKGDILLTRHGERGVGKPFIVR